MKIDTSEISSVLASALLVSGFVFVILRVELSRYFVTRRELREVETRLNGLEERLRGLPTHDDLKALGEKFSLVSREVAVVNQRVSGVHDTVNRIERQLELMMQAQLEREKD